MRRRHEGKVSVLTRGDLPTLVADENPLRKGRFNRQKSAEAVVPVQIGGAAPVSTGHGA
jgi:hypothetical protein